MSKERTYSSMKDMKVSDMIKELPSALVISNKLKVNSPRKTVEKVYSEHFKLEKPKPVAEPTIEQKKESLSDFIKATQAEAKDAKIRDKVYVSKFSNYNLNPKGVNKKGRLMRYAAGYDTLDLKEQNENNPDGVFVDLIHFESYSDVSEYFELDGFGTVRSRISVSKENPLLQEFLETHKYYGSLFVEYDERKRNKLAIMERERKAELEARVREASRLDLLVPLAYMDYQNGLDTFKELSSLDLYELKERAYDSIDYNKDEFVNALLSNQAKVLQLVNLARVENVIQVKDAGRTIIWSGNQQLITSVPIGRLWQEEMILFLLMPENSNILAKLSEILSFDIL